MNKDKNDIDYKFQVHEAFIQWNFLMPNDVINIILSYYYIGNYQLKFLLARYYANQRDIVSLEPLINSDTASNSKQVFLKKIRSKLEKQSKKILQRIRTEILCQKYKLDLYNSNNSNHDNKNANTAFDDENDDMVSSTPIWILPTSIEILITNQDKNINKSKLSSKRKNSKNSDANVSTKGNLKASKAKQIRELKRQNSIDKENGHHQKNDNQISNKIKIKINNDDINSESLFVNNLENKENEENIDPRLLSNEILQTLRYGYENLSFIKADPLSDSHEIGDTLRGQLWRAMLGVSKMDLNDYLSQIDKKESSKYSIIRRDAKQSFSKIKEYEKRIGCHGEAALVRILNSYWHKYDESGNNNNSIKDNVRNHSNGNWLSEMHTIAALMIYVMPELDSYCSFISIIKIHLQTYFNKSPLPNGKNGNNIGMWACCYLTYEILRLEDKKTYDKLIDRNIYPPYFLKVTVQTMIKPFNQMLKIWDFLIYFGMHMNPILLAAQLILHRQTLLNSNTPHDFLNDFLSRNRWLYANMHAERAIWCSMQLMVSIKAKARALDNNNNIDCHDHDEYKLLWNHILKHGTDLTIANQIMLAGERKYYHL